MSNYETTLRQIIYHYTQNNLPFDTAVKNRETITVRGKSIDFAPIRAIDDISLDDRIDACLDILVPSSLSFYNEEMRKEYYDIFVLENLMREIQFETVTYFLARWKTNIKKCIRKYNGLYSILSQDINWLSDYERNSIITDNDDITHGKRTETEGTGKTTNTSESRSEAEGQGTTKTVFEDTPETELLNANYATNITKTGQENINTVETTGSGTQDAETTGITQESGKTERDYERILKEHGRHKSVAEIIQEYQDKQTNIIENMVTETSKGLFMLIY